MASKASPPSIGVPAGGTKLKPKPATKGTKPKPKPASRGTKSGPRSHPFPIRLSDDERVQITQQAARFHLEKAAYIRARIFDYPLPSRKGGIDDEKYAELSRLVIDLRNAGGNINQLAHSCHLGFPVAVQKALEGIAQCREALDRVRLHLVQIAEDFERPKTAGSSDVVKEIWSEE